MPDNISLEEYIAQAQRGLMDRLQGNADATLRKAYLGTSSTTFNQTYGRKVWDALNNRKVTFNALRKVPWGNTAGWVLRTDRGSQRIRPVTEEGSLPTIDVSNYQGVYSLPKIPTGVFGVPVRTIFVNELEGGMGDVLAREQESCERDFVKDINKQLLSQSCLYVTKSGADVVMPTGINVEDHVRQGDTWAYFETGGTYVDTAQTVSAVTPSANSATLSTGVAATGDTLYIKSRVGLTSLFDVISEDGMAVCKDNAKPDVYNLTTRAAGGYAAGAYIDTGSGVARDLLLTHLDTCIQKIRERGGEPKLIVLGHDQYFKLERLLNAQQRYLGQEEYTVGVGDETTLPGTRTGLILATYMGIPILADADCAKSTDENGTTRGSDILVLDTDFIEIAVALPTQYVENRDYFAANALVVRGLNYMMAETRATRLDVHARITDLTA